MQQKTRFGGFFVHKNYQTIMLCNRVEAVSHSVIEHLRARQTANSGVSDGRKIALVLEGGGMRGIYLAGMLQALEAQGICAGHFDIIIGSSVGAYLACYFSVGKSAQAQDILLTDAMNSRFIHLRNTIRCRRILNHDWMVDDVFFKRKPFGDISHIQNLYAICTRVSDGLPNAFNLNTTEPNQRAILKATSAIPVIAGSAVNIGQELYVDGGISNQIPVEEAEKLGATDILVLLTRKHTHQRASGRSLRHVIEELALKWLYGSHISARYQKRQPLINSCLDDIDRGITPQGTRIEALFVPQNAPNIGRLTKHRTQLEKAAICCFEHTTTLFTHA